MKEKNFEGGGGHYTHLGTRFSFEKKKTLPFAFVQKSGQNEIGLGDRISTTESGLSEFNQN